MDLGSIPTYASDYILTWSDGPIGRTHLYSALFALLAGPALFLLRKGTQIHRLIGYGYALALLTLNLTALLIYDLTGGPNLFHGAAVASLATLIPAYLFVLSARRTNTRESTGT